MKLLFGILLAASIVTPIRSLQAQTSVISTAEATSSEASEAALYLSYRARVAQDFVEDELDSKTSRFYHDKAVRLLRAMNILALEMDELLTSEVVDSAAIDLKFEDIKFHFYQIDSTKRTLARYYRSQSSDIESTLNNVRTAVYYLEATLYE